MPTVSRLNPVKPIAALYVACGVLRAAEYMILRTDQSIFGEAFVHKLAGILLMTMAARHFMLGARDIGFSKRGAFQKILYGLLIGAVSFAIAYGAELFIQTRSGHAPVLQGYVIGYTLGERPGGETGLMFLAFCLIGNIINVIMEEGLFRGLFIRLAERRYTFAAAAALSSALFGVWHIAAPARGFLDGEMNVAQAVAMAALLVLTTGVTGVKFCLLTKLSGSLWMPMADHFFNNTIVNTLHVVTASGADVLQVVRISIAQTLSFLWVLFIYRKTGARYKQTFRS